MVNFVKYPSITNAYVGKFVDMIQINRWDEGIWFVQEKVHGANYSIFSDGVKARPAKRTGWIEDGEDFYNHADVFDKYRDIVIELSQNFSAPVAVYGELCGGHYSGDRQGTLVQRGVQYCPHNDFLVFDIKVNDVFLNDVFLDFSEMLEVCRNSQLHTSPVLHRGSFSECVAYPHEFDSQVGQIFGLSILPGNTCEGVVIRPNRTLFDNGGNRIILKNKNSKFTEKDHTPVKIITELPEHLASIAEGIVSCLNQNRLFNVVSKIGEVQLKEFGKLLGLFIQDAIQEVAGDQYRGLEKMERKAVEKAIQRKAILEVRQYFGMP